jgi:hypothetical protein
MNSFGSFNSFNPIAKQSLINKIKNSITSKLKALDNLNEYRVNIFIIEMICNEVASAPDDCLNLDEQKNLAYEICNILFGLSNSETASTKSIIEYLYGHNLVKYIHQPPEEPKYKFFKKSDSSKKRNFYF